MRKLNMPKEHFISINRNKKIYIDLIPLLPKAIETAIKSIPMPWMPNKQVDVVYSKNGNICFFIDKTKFTEKSFKEHFSYLKIASKNAKANISNFPIFDELKPVKNHITDTSWKQKTHKSIYQINSAKNNKGKYKKLHPFEIPLEKRSVSHSIKKKKNIFINENDKENNENIKTYKLSSKKSKIIDFIKTKYFLKTRMYWHEGVYCLLNSGYMLLNSFIRNKGIQYLEIDKNYNLNYQRKLTTKEKKKSHLGMVFHTTRELLKILKYIYDLFYMYKDMNMDEISLCRNIDFVFSNIGKLTEIYKYKYKVMHQIKRTIKKNNNVLWTDSWRVWVYLLRGYVPLLKNYWNNHIRRIQDTRTKGERKVTKQREDSAFDIKINEMIARKLGSNVKYRTAFQEKWKCWKTGKYKFHENDEINGILDQILDIKINRYKEKANSKISKNQKERKKQLNKIVRLHMLNEMKENKKKEIVPYEDAIKKFKQTEDAQEKQFEGFEILLKFIRTLNFSYSIDSPDIEAIKEYLPLAIETLKRLKSPSEIEEWLNNTDRNNLSKKIYKQIIFYRSFYPIKIDIKFYYKAIFWYESENIDVLTDLCLSLYLENEIKKICFDNHRNCVTKEEFVKEYCALKSLKGNMKFYKYCDLKKNITDLNFLRIFLEEMLDSTIIDFIISRLNSVIVYKDIEYINNTKIIDAFAFVPQLIKLMSLVIDRYLFENNIIIKFKNRIVCLCKENLEIKKIRFLNEISIDECLGVKDICFKENELISFSPDEAEYDKFEKYIFHITRNTHGKSFKRICDTWNNLLIQLIIKYRKVDEKRVYQQQIKVERAIMRGINSKRFCRYPQSIFYAPNKDGGLGMYSILDLEKLEEKVTSITKFVHYKKYCEDTYDLSFCQKHLSRKGIFYFHDLSILIDLNLYEDELLRGLNKDRFIENFTLKPLLQGNCEIENIFQQRTYKGFTKAQKISFLEIPNRRFIIWWSPILNRSKYLIGYSSKIENTGIELNGKLKVLGNFFHSIFRQKLWNKIETSILLEIENFKKYRNLQAVEIKVLLIWTDYDKRKEFIDNQNSCMNFSDNQIVVDLSSLKFCVFSKSHEMFLSLHNLVQNFLSNNFYISTLKERVKAMLNLEENNIYLLDIELYKQDIVVEVHSHEIFLFNPKNGNVYHRSNSEQSRLFEYFIEFCTVMKYMNVGVDKETFTFLNRKNNEVVSFNYKIYIGKLYISNYFKYYNISLKRVQNVYDETILPMKSFYNFITDLSLIKSKINN